MQKFLLFYHTAILAVAEGQTDAAPTLADVKATRAALSAGKGISVYLRDASSFDGNPESGFDGLLFLGRTEDNAEEFERIVEAYAAYEIPHEDVDLHQPEAPGEDEGDEDAPTGMAALMAEATDLGLHFSPQIGEETLRKRVEAEKAKRAAAAGGESN